MQQPSRGPHPLLSVWNPRARGIAAAVIAILLSAALAEDGARAAAGLARRIAVRVLDWRDLERALAAAGSGRDGLPPAALVTADALAASGARAFRLSEGMERDDLLRQRISEVAWPLPIDPAAAVVVRRAEEPSSCLPLAQNIGVAVDRCD